MTADPSVGDVRSPIENPLLAIAVGEVEDWVATSGWDQPAQLFALVRTADLISAEPALAASLDPQSWYTPIAQDQLAAGDLSAALAAISWPAEVAGCVLVHEILVLPPGTEDAEPVSDADTAANHPLRAEARLAVGVERDGSRACLLRVRGDAEDSPLRGADLAPGLAGALLATFID